MNVLPGEHCAHTVGGWDPQVGPWLSAQLSPLGAWASLWQVCSEGTEGMSGGVRDKGKVRSGKGQGAFPCNLLAAHLVVDLWTSGEGG